MDMKVLGIIQTLTPGPTLPGLTSGGAATKATVTTVIKTIGNTNDKITIKKATGQTIAGIIDEAAAIILKPSGATVAID